ncbi:protein-tyrosine-phosphatase [Hirschia baltica]|uniref:Protein tyrosine phosphatase n=1 Tax=Hirschia baltica (strain ATCC 49814 / DSM 5838 / IFAM 1418) TaxID=582402 RepID=C6XK10_HIRBI|nr:protein-tyrosine-phosphatase [Hirschia baltica]ACT59455.1 protein tyrosine phosphatase [Hirschia baltica ATCC 49814]
MASDADIQSVLFVCTYNAVRSIMAEALLKGICGRQKYVQSAGVHMGGEPDVFVIAAMKEVGIDVSHHSPRALSDMNEGSFDLIIALSEEAHLFAIEETRTESVDIEFWPTYDATSTTGSRDRKMEAYREVRDQLLAKIKDRFAK